MRIISWNVNGYRAVWKKGFLDWLTADGADIVCLQETKAWAEQLTEAQLAPAGYHSAFSQPERKGYSGVATFSKVRPDSVRLGYEVERFDAEGRVLLTEHLGGKLLLANIYFPNGQKDEVRLQYKLDFYEATLELFSELDRQGHNLVIVGDVNTAHTADDLARPKQNETVSGFLPVERAWLDRWTEAGFVDAFRLFHEGKGHYTWWTMRVPSARANNVGWRIDYAFVNQRMRDAVVGAAIEPEVMGSDHCPVVLELDSTRL